MSDNLKERLRAEIDKEYRIRREHGLALGLAIVPPPGDNERLLMDSLDAIEKLEKLRQDGETITERYMQFASLHNDQEDYLIAKDYNARFQR